MRLLNITIFVNIIFNFSAHSQTTVQEKHYLYSKGAIEIDTSKQSSDEAIDGIRTEIKSKKTGAKKADEAYRNLGFKASAGKYLEGVDPENMDQETTLRVANSFRLNSQTEEAEYWYSNVITEKSKPKHILRYAQVLQSNGKCEDATRWYKCFEEIASRRERRNRELIINCEDLKNIKHHENVKIENITVLNTGHLDFSPIPYQDGIIFSSTRKNNKPKEVIDSWTNDNFSDLYYAEFDKNSKEYNKPKALKGDLNKKFHEGVATFNQSGTVMFFTRNNNNGKSKSKDGLIDLKIYSAILDEGGYWTQITELPFNSNEFTSCHPSLSKDGRKLYFASNRPGGYGGLDIYFSENKGGNWQEPQNLGPIVNSAGNELFPVIQKNGTLYYSSNGHQGLGGLDIFYAKKADSNDDSSWNIRENLGTPFNSLKDDFGFVDISDGNQTGFLTSNREGGKGKDDIYTWSIGDGTKDNEFATENSFGKMNNTLEESTGSNVNNNQNHNNTYITITVGEETETLGTYGTPKNVQVGGRKIVVESAVIRDNSYHIEGVVVDPNSGAYLRGATVILISSCANEGTRNMTTDASGSFNFNIQEGCCYDIKASLEGYIGSPIRNQCTNTLKEVSPPASILQAIMNLSPINNNVYANQNPLVKSKITGESYFDQPNANKKNITPWEYDPEDETYIEVATGNPYDGPANGKMIKNGKIDTSVQSSDGFDISPTTYAETEIVNNGGNIAYLLHIYYDFDQSYIREEAQSEIQKLCGLMKENPDIVVEIASHTDARGSFRYNRSLSQRRAESVVRALIDCGIESDRLMAKGYGETKNVNNCADNIPCSEREHQRNRRTEFRIVSCKSCTETVKRSKENIEAQLDTCHGCPF